MSRIEDTAAQWLLRQEEADWSDADQSELDAWLEASPAHQAAFWRLEHGWRRADRVSALGPVEKPRRVPAPRPWMLAASLAAVALLAGGIFAGGRLLTPRTTYVTEVGGRETAPLADGTKVELNTDTRLRTTVTAKAREVWLDRGEAYFEVAHDPGRPFVVHAGERTVTVLGTKFSVRRDGDAIRVSVVEGKVRVDRKVVTRGDVVMADGASTLVAEKSPERVSAELSWREGMLSFEQSTLADAAAEFNRYNHKKVVITDPAAGAMRISGAFDAENVDAFGRLLRRAYGLKVADEGGELKISS